MIMYRLYYDDDCPLCVAYTGWFVKFKLLPKEGRVPYSSIENEVAPNLDKERAKNEIALVNAETGIVLYGMDSLVEILNQKLPFVKPVAQFPPIYFLLVQLYKLISYNRKVIVGDQACNKLSCTPDYNVPYRLAFLIIAAMLSAFVLNTYTKHLQSVLLNASLWRELLVCFGQIGFQYVMTIVLVDKPFLRLHYLGNMMVVSLIGSLLLIPLIFLHTFYSLPDGIFLGHFILVVMFMLWVHVRRVKAMGVSGLLSLTWILYRILVLSVIYAFGLFL